MILGHSSSFDLLFESSGFAGLSLACEPGSLRRLSYAHGGVSLEPEGHLGFVERASWLAKATEIERFALSWSSRSAIDEDPDSSCPYFPWMTRMRSCAKLVLIELETHWSVLQVEL